MKIGDKVLCKETYDIEVSWKNLKSNYIPHNQIGYHYEKNNEYEISYIAFDSNNDMFVSVYDDNKKTYLMSPDKFQEHFYTSEETSNIKRIRLINDIIKD